MRVTKVVVADDHPIAREGLRSVIQNNDRDFRVVLEASNGRDVIRFAERNRADIYILDISMPLMNGIETTKALMKMDPRSRIIILSFHDERRYIERALIAGARGYLLKESAVKEILVALNEVLRDKFYLSPAISKYVVDGFLGRAGRPDRMSVDPALTPREREVLQLIGEGQSDKQIAELLCISSCTVHQHRKNIMHKLDMHKQAELIRYAIKEGISKL